MLVMALFLFSIRKDRNARLSVLRFPFVNGSLKPVTDSAPDSHVYLPSFTVMPNFSAQ